MALDLFDVTIIFQEMMMFMYHHHNVAAMWEIMACIGFVTDLLILAYSVWWAKTGQSAAVTATSVPAKVDSEGKAE